MGGKTWLLDGNRLGLLTNEKNSLMSSISNILTIAKGEFEIYSWNFGNELVNIMSEPEDIISIKAEKYIKECLLYDDRINDVTNIKIEKNHDKLKICFEVLSDIGVIKNEVAI